jgi:hypothetical protein
MSETKFKFADGRTKLPWFVPDELSYKNEALKIKKVVQKSGKENWTDAVYSKLGRPFWKTENGKNIKSGPAVSNPKEGSAYHIKSGGKDKSGEQTIGRTLLSGHRDRKVKSGKQRVLDQELTTPDKQTRRNADLFIKNKSGPGTALDHRLTNVRLARGVRDTAAKKGITVEEAVDRARNRYHSAGEGYGHEKENLQDLPSKQNQLKETQEKALDKYYKLKENPPSKSNKKAYSAWRKKVDAAALQLRALEKEAEQFKNGNNGDNGDHDDNGKKLKIKNGDKKKPPNGTGGGGNVEVSNKKLKNAALVVGKNLPGALSVPATTANAYMMIKNALATPSKRNIALAILGGVEAGADIAGLVPMLALPAEALSQGAGKIGGGLQTMNMLKNFKTNSKLKIPQVKRLQGAGI